MSGRRASRVPLDSSSSSVSRVDDGFEFKSKKRVGPASSAAAPQQTQTQTENTNDQQSNKPKAKKPKSSHPSSSYPSYPISSSSSSSLTFDTSVGLEQSVPQLFRQLLAAEQKNIENTYTTHTNKEKDFSYLSKATREVEVEFLKELEKALKQDAAINQQNKVIIENPKNVELREQIDKYSVLAQKTSADIAAWKQILADLDNALHSPTPSSSLSLCDSDRSLLFSHRGGALGRLILDTLRVCAVKGDAAQLQLQNMHTLVQQVHTDNLYLTQHVNADEKKKYGDAVDDPKQFISQLLAQQ